METQRQTEPPKLLITGEWTNWGDGGYCVEEETPAGEKRNVLFSFGIRRTDRLAELFQTKVFIGDEMEGEVLSSNMPVKSAHQHAYYTACRVSDEILKSWERYQGSRREDRSPFMQRAIF